MMEREVLLRETQKIKSEQNEREIASKDKKTSKVRILWPALGFPAVIYPNPNSEPNTSNDGNATRCICVLILTDNKNLSTDEVSQFLRCVPWNDRSRRHISFDQNLVGIFRKEDIKILRPNLGVEDTYGKYVAFGSSRNSKGTDGIAVTLAKAVMQLYARFNLNYLYEIRINEKASRRLKDGQYHIFWNNSGINENVPSDEMMFLLDFFAYHRDDRPKKNSFYIDEYKYEYGSLHQPYLTDYNKQNKGKKMHTEVLHPLFIEKPSESSKLKISSLADTHLNVVADVYEKNLRQHNDPTYIDAFNNWNKNFSRIYADAKGKKPDVVFIVGDIIDYGRGFLGLNFSDNLNNDDLYHKDRNWFLFYYLLASGNNYSRPVYTILGNHDWRINPYVPFGKFGSPSSMSLFTKLSSIAPKGAISQVNNALKVANSPKKNWKPGQYIVSFNAKAEKIAQSLIGGDVKILSLKFFASVFKNWGVVKSILGTGKLNEKGFPTETTVDSIVWYLLLINPFLDYQFKHPCGQSVLMLDWAEGETLLLEGTLERVIHTIAKTNFLIGACASKSLTNLQNIHVQIFTDPINKSKSKIIGIHSPPLGIWEEWYDDDLIKAWREYKPHPNYKIFSIKHGNKTLKGYPFVATLLPSGDIIPDTKGLMPLYGSFEKDREWFIQRAVDKKSNIRLVISGHNHRFGVYRVFKPGGNTDKLFAKQLLIQALSPTEIPGVLDMKIDANTKRLKTWKEPTPLFLVCNSVGPRGHIYATKPKDKENQSDIEKRHARSGYTYIEILNSGVITTISEIFP